MVLPNIEHRLSDASRKVMYVVVAYRQLTRDECRQAIATYNAQRKRRPKAGTEVRILTIIGAT